MDTNSTIAVIGGARWGHVTLSELTKMKLPFKQIVAVSKYNSESIQQLLDKRLPTTTYTLKWVETVDELLTHYNPTAAIIVNAAPQHYATAMKLIDYGVNMLIEKPVVLSAEDALALLDKAAELGVCIVPGLNYRFLSYLTNFAQHVAKFPSQPRSFTLDWADAKGDVRYFKDILRNDATTDVAQDLMSHVWAILAMVLQKTDMAVDTCKVTGAGTIVNFNVTVQDFFDTMKGGSTTETDAKALLDSVTFTANASKLLQQCLVAL